MIILRTINKPQSPLYMNTPNSPRPRRVCSYIYIYMYNNIIKTFQRDCRDRRDRRSTVGRADEDINQKTDLFHLHTATIPSDETRNIIIIQNHSICTLT